ncbi:E3 ubiquitin-protein ligase RHF2A -like protein [Tripterygium wilfordii]|uniref:RING-type E3 ubiquitin transferase n=1 Tax=Tripterygium wilfordii TaxID=458696 RepID=A0A7J7CRV5_TRIWF|nr:E3 ubiquitin-protein ligase RHF1A-like [Tripterygium wilfordii]KAF5736835.1 E3 ubiquitin-protein ligase RHF2A -like protein [Tripterygium wilfordii]
MESFASFLSSSSASFDDPIKVGVAASSSTGLVDDTIDDACSICLDPFTDQDPATVTSCKHEYHLQCILEWSQRSRECPNCWQFFFLKDPASQELLAAVESERHCRSRNVSHSTLTTHHQFHEDADVEQDGSYSDDSDFDEHIMQHFAAAAASRAHNIDRRVRQIYSVGSPSQVRVSSSPVNLHSLRQTYPTSLGEFQSLSELSCEGNSHVSGSSSPVNIQLLSSVANMVSSTAGAGNRDCPLKPRLPPPQSPHQTVPTETPSFSEAMKSKWSAASARCKESISKGTRGIKEKLLARNNAVKDLSKGVQREMNAGIARMIERLDLTPKRTEASDVDGFHKEGGTSNFSSKGKGLLENIIADKPTEVVPHVLNSGSPSHMSGTLGSHLQVSNA